MQQWNGNGISSVSVKNPVNGEVLASSTDGSNLMVSFDSGALMHVLPHPDGIASADYPDR